MKTTLSPKLIVLSLVALALAMTGHCQVYQFSTPIVGGISLAILDTNDPVYNPSGDWTDWTALTETIYVDPVAGTIRQVGFISTAPSNVIYSITETQQVTTGFPNPPSPVSGTVTGVLSVAGGVISFDTGYLPVTWTVQAYTVNATNLAVPIIPIIGTYSLTTGGEQYSGSFTNYVWPNPYQSPAYTGFSTSNYPTSLALLALDFPYYRQGTQSAAPEVALDLTASNGFHLALSLNTGASNLEFSVPMVIVAPEIAEQPPTITLSPQSLVAIAYQGATFTVIATGTPPLSYQWSLNSTNIAGATASSLAISNVAQTNLGAYSIVVTNAFGSDTSSNAMLWMYPFIAVPFEGAVTYWGNAAVFSVQAWGTGPLSYQWFQNGVALQNATNETLTFGSIQATNAGFYSVVVCSALGSVTNTPEQVVVEPAGVSLGFCPVLTISGVVGYSYIIQSAANLTGTNAWVTLTNLTLTQPVQIWVDTSVDASSPFNSNHFYRVLPGQ